jgi:general secretion pathway protein D
MVFLRPIVMRDAESANKFSTDRYEQIRGLQKDNQPTPSIVMPINQAPVLPARPQGSEPLAPPSAPTAESPSAPPKAPS